MPDLQHSAKVNAPLAFVWEQLVRKVYHPEEFLTGVTDVQILEDGPGARAIRRMTLKTPNGASLVI